MSNYKNAINALYLYRNGYIETLNKERRNTIIGNSFLSRLKTILFSFFKEFKLLLFHQNLQIDIEDKIVCIVNSKNNYEALKFLRDSDVVFLKATVLGNSMENVITHRFKSKFFFSILFFVSLPFIIINKQNRRDLYLLYRAYGLNSLFTKLVQKQKPKLVVFANDHIPETRSYILACQKMGIKTAYIQHGSVSTYFPPLEFDLALLESKYSEASYKKSKNIDTEIKLIGMPKLDSEISKIRQRNQIKKIGIAINQNDDLNKVENIISSLIKNNFKVILRKHPADVRKIKSNFKIENGNNMSVFDFISHSDFLVASDSSIHVEANSVKCRSVYYQFHDNNSKYDYYGFVKNKFVDEVKNASELIELVGNFNYKTFNFNTPEISYYNEALKSNIYGKSSILAKKYIYESINS
ncbi:hypothetical protein [Aureivirga sp. CE67]|uniref:hypothetical protein n=1 Tax=Aureivirga sp. CE67 TaxID=1788983 RepID=UPI0018CA4984|nr:hypothetical protein [Aureivirga sp. CE67]